jgi:hypothetical protein
LHLGAHGPERVGCRAAAANGPENMAPFGVRGLAGEHFHAAFNAAEIE